MQLCSVQLCGFLSRISNLNIAVALLTTAVSHFFASESLNEAARCLRDLLISNPKIFSISSISRSVNDCTKSTAVQRVKTSIWTKTDLGGERKKHWIESRASATRKLNIWYIAVRCSTKITQRNNLWCKKSGGKQFHLVGVYKCNPEKHATTKCAAKRQSRDADALVNNWMVLLHSPQNLCQYMCTSNAILKCILATPSIRILNDWSVLSVRQTEIVSFFSSLFDAAIFEWRLK